MDEQENTDLVRKMHKLFRNGDESFSKGFSDDISWELPEMNNLPYAGKFNGIDAVTDFFGRLGEAEECLIHNPTEFIAKDDKVIVLGNSKWRVKSTNKEYDSLFAQHLDGEGRQGRQLRGIYGYGCQN
ncbi:MAG: hypothetical protein ABJB34_03440 [Acidobacteriota bacterium]